MQTDSPTDEIGTILLRTQQWLDEVIIKQQFCPFAKEVRDKQQIHFSVQQQSDTSSLLRQLIAECDTLLGDDKIETSLLIYSAAFKDFNDYLDFLDMANQLIHDTGLEGKLQLASFHPEYLFADTSPDCPSHYTNRSPYPMLHILREDSITEALESFAHPESIPERNIAHAKVLGVDFFKTHLSK